MSRRNPITGGAPNQPFGQDARMWNLRSFPVSVTTTRTQLSKGGLRVPFATISASRNNTDFITVGLGDVAIENGIRQLGAGDGFTLFMSEDGSTRTFSNLGGCASELWRPRDLVDLHLFFAIANSGTQKLLVAVADRQPT